MLCLKKTDFIELIRKPELPSAKHIPALKQVSVDFPYFIHAKVLLAKALFQENHYEYDKFLKHVALTVPDREVLHDYLNNKKRKYDSIETTLSQNIDIKQPPLTVETILGEKDPEQIEPDNTAKEEPTPEPLSIIETSVATIVQVAEQEIEEEPQFIAEPEAAPIEENIEQTIVVSNITPVESEITVTEEVVTEEVVTEEVETVLTEAFTVTQIEEVIAPAIPSTDNNEPQLAKELQQNDTHSFMEWLSLAKGEKPNVEKQAVESEKIVQVEQQSKEHITNEPVKPLVEVTREDIERAVAKSNVNDFQNILDKFIKENPSISRPKAEFFNPVNMAKQSVEEDEQLVTETLANLYYKQGNHKRAIRAYEKLCLIYPSKMSYFANLIQKIKSEIKD